MSIINKSKDLKVYRHPNVNTIQDLITVLKDYWKQLGCIIIQPLDMEIGAATSHPITFFQAIGPEPMSAAYVQVSRRPTDSRYAQNPNRLQQYYQFQVIIKPSPKNISQLYLSSLETIGIYGSKNDIRFIEDNWENPTLGAYGLGWEIWLNGMEISQFTYFQKIGGLDCFPIMSEITYGLERLALFIQKKDNVYNLIWGNTLTHCITYKDLYYQNELDKSRYNFKYANTDYLLKNFNQNEKEIHYLLNLKKPLIIPSYELVLKLIHTFNLLDSRKVISITERKNYILRIQKLSQIIAETYYELRKTLGFPMCNN